jgi:hypothetical protein
MGFRGPLLRCLVTDATWASVCISTLCQVGQKKKSILKMVKFNGLKHLNEILKRINIQVPKLVVIHN